MTNEELFFDALKSHRESKDIEISEICEFTKINPKYIEAIEGGEFSVLPIVYMRLFLRAYSNFIGADSQKALEDFELHTTGKIQKKINFEIKPTQNSGMLDTINVNLESTSQITPKRIATGAAVIIGLFLVLYWAGQITNEQNSEVEKASSPIEENIPEAQPVQNIESVPLDDIIPSDNSTEKKSLIIDHLEGSDIKKPVNMLHPPLEIVGNTIPKKEEGILADLPNKLPLNTNDFLPKNKDHETTNIVKLFAPYIITILTLEETKLNISKSNKDELTELINTVTPEGKLFQFNFESTINFEFWNTTHIRMKLNEIPLDTFLSDDGFSVRGSYEADKSQLYLGFYRN